MATQEAPREAALGIIPSGEQWKLEKEAREESLEAFYRQLSEFNAIPDSKLTKWELSERNEINELLTSGAIDFGKEKDTVVDVNGIRRGVPFQAFMNSLASRALTDEQAEKDRNILEKYNRSPISGIRGNGERSNRLHSQLIESARKGVRTKAEAAKRVQTGIKEFRPPAPANEEAPWGKIRKIKGTSVKTLSPEWLLKAVAEKPAASVQVQRPTRASAWETIPRVEKFPRDDRSKGIFTQTEPTAPKLDVNYADGHSTVPIPEKEKKLDKFESWPKKEEKPIATFDQTLDYHESFDEGTVASGELGELERPNPFDEILQAQMPPLVPDRRDAQVPITAAAAAILPRPTQRPRESGVFTSEAVRSRGGTIMPDRTTTTSGQAQPTPETQTIAPSHPELEYLDDHGNRYIVDFIEVSGGEQSYILRRISGYSPQIKRISKGEFESSYTLSRPNVVTQAPVTVQKVSRIRNFFSRIKNFFLRRRS